MEFKLIEGNGVQGMSLTLLNAELTRLATHARKLMDLIHNPPKAWVKRNAGKIDPTSESSSNKKSSDTHSKWNMLKPEAKVDNFMHHATPGEMLEMFKQTELLCGFIDHHMIQPSGTKCDQDIDKLMFGPWDVDVIEK